MFPSATFPDMPVHPTKSHLDDRVAFVQRDSVQRFFQPGNLIRLYFRNVERSKLDHTPGHDFIFLRKSTTPGKDDVMVGSMPEYRYHFLEGKTGTVEVVDEINVALWIHRIELIAEAP